MRLMEERGFEAEWARGLYSQAQGGRAYRSRHGGAHRGVRTAAASAQVSRPRTIAQVRREAVAKGLITDAEIDAVLARLDAPDFAVFSPVMFTAWGRSP